MTDRGARSRRRAVRVVFAALLAMAVAVLGLPAAGATADTGSTQGTAVLKIGSQMTLTASANPTAPNSDVTITATFAVIAGNSDVSPTGSVTFLDNGTELGNGTLNGQSASWTGPLPLGTHPITASYPGDSNYTAAVADPLSLNVAYVPTLSISVTGGTTALTNNGSWSPDITVTAASDPAATDLPHTRFRVDVDYSNIASFQPDMLALQSDGTVVTPTAQSSGHLTFDVGPGADLSPGNSTGVTFQLKALPGAPVGTLTVNAALLSSPDGQDWSQSVGNASQDFTVQQNSAPTPTTTSVTAASVVTDGLSAPVTMTATVSPNPGDGVVQFLADGVTVDAADVSQGSAGTVSVSASLGLGYHTISATYAGNSHFATSTGTQQQQISVTPPGGTLHAIEPVRLLDTRFGVGAPRAQLGANKYLDLQVAGRGGVPATGVAAISVNITVVQPVGSGFVTVYPSDKAVPVTANIDFPKVVNTAGLVVTALSASGTVRILNRSTGAINVIADVAAWFSQPQGSVTAQGRYIPVAPLRLADTRKTGRMTPRSTLTVQVAGMGDIPKTGVGAAVLNVTVVNASAPAWLAVYPGGGTLPLVSTNAFLKGETRAGRVIVGVGSNGKVNIFNSPNDSVDVVVDIVGWFTSSASSQSGSTFIPLPVSQRLTPAQTGGSLWSSGTTRVVPIAGVDGVNKLTDPVHPVAVVGNLHVSAPRWSGYLVVFPLAVRPLASDLNFVPGQSVQNLSIAKLGTTGGFNLFSTTGPTTITVDIYGWFG